MKILISGGGTGGHVYPAIAIAEELRQIDKDCEILFVGAKGRMEMEKVPKAGYPIVGLPISGIQRRLTWKNLKVPLNLIWSFWKVRRVLKKFNPDVVLGVGGYASAPAVKMAQWMNLPTALLEPNNFPGMANKVLAKGARKIFVAFRDMDRFFSADKIVVSGNPVRKDIRSLSNKKEEAMRFFDWGHSKKTLLLFGGSLGARTLNAAIKDAVGFFKERSDVALIWQTGKSGTSFIDCETANLPNVRAMQFIDRMDLAYALADLVICRAGALTLSELALVGKSAVLVPSPNVAEDHQTKNAKYLSKRRAAEMVADEDVGEKLIPLIEKLLKDEERLKELGLNVRKEAHPDAAHLIATELIKLIQTKN